MPAGWVHQVHSLIEFGLPYATVHSRKDWFSRRSPGLCHRQVGHRKYQSFGKSWSFDRPFSNRDEIRVDRIAQWKGPIIAEEFMVSVSHDLDDRVWDFDGTARDERAFRRKRWEGFCAWLILNPAVLKAWAQVDVLAGRIHRVIDGVEVWKHDPELIPAYAVLLRRVRFVLSRDRMLREVVAAYDQSNAAAALSNNAFESRRSASAVQRER